MRILTYFIMDMNIRNNDGIDVNVLRVCQNVVLHKYVNINAALITEYILELQMSSVELFSV